MTSASSNETQDSTQLHRPPAPDPEPGTIRYSTGEPGRPAVYDMTGCAPHMLIPGRTAYGRTTAIRMILLEAARQGTGIRFCDLKRAPAAVLNGLAATGNGTGGTRQQ